MLKLTRWCTSHRRQVVMGWVAIAVLATVLAGRGTSVRDQLQPAGDRVTARE